MKNIKFIFALHNHQPVGNFDTVFEESYEKAYKPLLDLVKKHPGIAVSLHYSGPLLEWLIRHKPEFTALVHELTDRGNVELLSGAYYEPMLTLLPEKDRLGQIKLQNALLRDVFAYSPAGMWLPERVWSPDIPYSVFEGGLKYTMIDECHISRERPVKGYYNSEMEGRTCGVFPISQDLRELIPHQSPEKAIDFLLSHTSENEQDVLVFIDNGEKFGTYPQSESKIEWLQQFFELLKLNSACIRTSTFMNYWKQYMPLGLRYPTEGAYPEMDEWALSENGFGKGWRSFLMKYPESNWMHKRMSQISRKIDTLESSGNTARSIRKIRKQFWSGTTHDAYWHGIFGGIYLPHLRNVTWNNLISAESAVDQKLYNLSGQIYQEATDINRDGYVDITVITKNLRAVFDSKIMGGLEELDYKPAKVNLCSTIACYPEDFHKEMDVRPVYDKTPRYSLIERYYDMDIDIDLVREHALEEASDFLNEAVEVKNTVHTHCVRFSRSGWINWQRAHLCKTISFNDNGFDIHYKIKNNGIAPIRFSFGPEFNFSVNSGPWEQRFYDGPEKLRGKTLEHVSDTDAVTALLIKNTADHYQIRITNPEPARLMTYPHVIPVLSPSGIENIFQNVVLNYFWKLHINPRSEKHIRLSVEILPCD
jgi:4-alpha-glucanotransferase